MKTKKVAVIGANELKGREIVRFFLKNEWPVENIVALDLKKHAGKVLALEKKRIYIKEIKEDLLKDVDMVYIVDSMNFEPFINYLKKANRCYLFVFDNNFSEPLLLKGFTELSDLKSYAIPNSVSVAILYAIRPLINLGKIKKIIYTAMQSVSDLGNDAISEIESQYLDYVNLKMMKANILPTKNAINHYPIALNIIPQTSDFNNETMQSRDEYLQTFQIKHLLGNLDLEVSATALRVPLIRTDCISLYVELEETIDIFEYIERVNADDHLTFLDDPINNIYPMPLNAEGDEKILIGRLRMVKENAIQLFIAADNLIAGTGNVAYELALMCGEDNEVS